MADYIAPIQRLIEEFRRLPGVGSKTAARYAFAALNFTEDEAKRFADALTSLLNDVHKCPICGGLSTSPECCEICADEDRDRGVICVVENAKDVMVMEKIRGYKGVYHVLGGALSPIDNVTVKDLRFAELIERVKGGEVREVIIATNPTPGGDTTAAYLVKVLEPYNVEVSRLAYGIPVGADIEYADEVTLYRAMEGRRYFN
ncbi:MAG: recombination protein RecR [Clostridia bacterium]|nr:recombination protein RecR [Clostridia bacterium]